MLTDKDMFDCRVNYLAKEMEYVLQDIEVTKDAVLYSLIGKSFFNIDTGNIRKSYIEDVDGAVIAKGIRYYAINPIWLKMIVNKNGKVAVEIDKDFKDGINND